MTKVLKTLWVGDDPPQTLKEILGESLEVKSEGVNLTEKYDFKYGLDLESNIWIDEVEFHKIKTSPIAFIPKSVLGNDFVKIILKRFFSQEGTLYIDDYKEAHIEKSFTVKVLNDYSIGHISDVILNFACEFKIDHFSLRCYIFNLLSYISLLERVNLISYPVDLDCGISKDVFFIQMSCFDKGVIFDDIKKFIESKKNYQGQVVKRLIETTRFLDIMGLPKVEKIILTSCWFIDEENIFSLEKGLLVHGVENLEMKQEGARPTISSFIDHSLEHIQKQYYAIGKEEGEGERLGETLFDSENDSKEEIIKVKGELYGEEESSIRVGGHREEENEEVLKIKGSSEEIKEELVKIQGSLEDEKEKKEEGFGKEDATSLELEKVKSILEKRNIQVEKMNQLMNRLKKANGDLQKRNEEYQKDLELLKFREKRGLDNFEEGLFEEGAENSLIHPDHYKRECERLNSQVDELKKKISFMYENSKIEKTSLDAGDVQKIVEENNALKERVEFQKKEEEELRDENRILRNKSEMREKKLKQREAHLSKESFDKKEAQLEKAQVDIKALQNEVRSLEEEKKDLILKGKSFEQKFKFMNAQIERYKEEEKKSPMSQNGGRVGEGDSQLREKVKNLEALNLKMSRSLVKIQKEMADKKTELHKSNLENKTLTVKVKSLEKRVEILSRKSA